MKNKIFTLKKICIVGALAFVGIAATYTDNHNRFFEISKNLEIFTNLYKEINTYYVDDLDPAKMMRIGVDAMLDALDPYTNYISESEIEGYRYMTEGKYNGIGASVHTINDVGTIAEIFEGSPAFKAGLKVGDVIVAVDGQSSKGKSIEDIYDILKGYPGTEIKLTIHRPGVPKDLDLKLVREEVEISNVPYSGLVANDVAYLSLSTFTRDAGANIEKSLKEIKDKNPNLKGIVLDLRGNGGGLLTEAVNLCNVFIPRNELVVSTKGKVAEWDRSFKTFNNPVDEKTPVVVLIDKNSASASEIVCGTLQDLDRAVLMGQRSYGKGLVQNTRDIGYNSKVKLTTAKYYIPSGRCIQGVNYKDGKPVNIPDSLRTAFKTKNGRKVLDGGGVTPDVMLNLETKSAVVKSMIEKNIIFDYVTQYCIKNVKIDPIATFQFTDFDDFLSFIENRKFVGNTESEKTLQQFRENASKEKYLDEVQNDLKIIENKINTQKKLELTAHKEEVLHLIEKEIVGRYYYEKGKSQMALKNDKAIDEAVKLLHDTSRYNAILKGM